MFFILSKTLNYLTMPIVLITICLILAAILKSSRLKRIAFYLALGMLLFFSNSFIANEVMKAWEVDPIPFEEMDKDYKLAIVLSGVIIGDTETPSSEGNTLETNYVCYTNKNLSRWSSGNHTDQSGRKEKN